MTILSIKEAAKAAGISKQTMYRRVKEGKVSSVSLLNGEKGVDTSELLRVFGALVSSGDEKDRALTGHGLVPTENERLLEIENHLLKKQVESLTEDKKRIFDAFEQSQKNTERLLEAPKRGLGIIERIFGKKKQGQAEQL